jgi:pimeloyl-ACP methyl ester carboxylesterase
VSEKALLFGRTKSLVGILTEPGPGRDSGGRPGVVILNAGVLHRVGPNRLHVQFARALAEAGFTTLRFDLSGIGDSRPREGVQTYAASARDEIGEALDLLAASHKLDRFLVIGICSGADKGLQAAVHDPRIVGTVLIDGFNLPSLGFVLHFYRQLLVSARGWARLLTGRSETWAAVRRFVTSPRKERPAQARIESSLPSPDDYVRQIRAIADRGTHLLLVYSARSPAYFNYRSLLRKRLPAWPSRERVTVERFEDTDHTFTLCSAQERLVRLVRDWAAALPPGPSQPPSPPPSRASR